ncbi:succinate dehydrogenase, hydrophobic membrane anchor protein [Amantichitinum ursilacus]|uniref:Succinate dehydrogenase hydrophobic membrane anchor subunit n=1 Tax=Amantichitinum ursilacus TaxID=857265 RepID=A0A0N1JSQ4_9NEIS|nr:succinate dehydrogenase, hydrophobic membrane anchor protein [Amantichitinum ursilacus]KPC52898.1 Succinate dehydrogenase hydrophobic membrane anchor subunit [Amantichitinum ursilacus]
MVIKRPVIGAHYGLKDWLVQRLTAVVMLAYVVGVIVFLLASRGGSYEAWQHLFACSWVRVLTQVTVLALLWHAWVGVRDIWMDYIQHTGLKLAAHTLTILWLVASLVYSVKVVWGA